VTGLYRFAQRFNHIVVVLRHIHQVIEYHKPIPGHHLRQRTRNLLDVVCGEAARPLAEGDLGLDEDLNKTHIFPVGMLDHIGVEVVALGELSLRKHLPNVAGHLLIAVVNQRERRHKNFAGESLGDLWRLLLVVLHDKCDPLKYALV